MIELHAKGEQDLSPLIRKIKAAATMHYLGYVTGEMMAGMQDSSIMLTLSTCHSLEDWEQSAALERRAKLCQQIEPLCSKSRR